MRPVHGRAAPAAFLLAAVIAVPAGAGDDEVDDKGNARQEFRYFIDSSTERVPATTAVPTYPRIARRDRIEGDATVCFRIDIDGRVRSIRVKNYTHRIFRRPALQAIKASSFEPLPADRMYSRERVCRTYRFRLTPVAVAESRE